MHKHELVSLTLDRLIDRFKSSPEYFDSDRSPNRSCQPLIVWQPKVQLTDYMETIINDPNNCHAVTILFNPLINEITCHIFLKAPPDISSHFGHKADCIVSSRRWFERYRGNYKKFIELKKCIIARDTHKDNISYLKKLSSVFLDSLDDHIK
jgi:hypothetical protein